MLRKALFVLLLGLMLLGGTARADLPRKVLLGGDSKIIYVITPSLTNPIFRHAARAAVRAATAYGYIPKVVSHDDSPVKQAALFERAISEKAAAIVCDNAGSDATIPAIKRAYDNNIPTFLIDRELSENGFAVSQLIANTRKAAARLAEILAQQMQYEGEYCEFYGLQSDLNAIQRSEAFHEVLDRYPDLHCVKVIYANWDEKEAREEMFEVIKNYPRLRGVISANDSMALGALDALRSANVTGVNIVSIDGTREVRNEILSGNILATALQPISEMVNAAMIQLHRYLFYGTTTRHEVQYFECQIVDRQNVESVNRQYSEYIN